jgi:hypothetical protein
LPTQPRIARILLTSATGTREWIATAATQDNGAGSSVEITITQTTSGATPPGAANTLELIMQTDTGTAIRTFDLTEASGSQSVTFHFTDNGTSGGAARSGTVELNLRAVRTDLGTYDVQSDGSPNTPPTGFTSALDRGWIRGTTSAVHTVSNVSAGGGKNQPLAYGDQIFQRTVLGAGPYKSETIVHGFSPLSSSAASLTATFDTTHAGVVDERFSAALVSTATTAVPGSSALTGLPWTVLTNTTDSANVDPRVTAVHLLQLNDNAFASNPLDKNDSDGRRLTSDLGFVATRLITARNEGVNGATVATSLQDINGLITAITDSDVTGAEGGSAAANQGWTGFKAWDSQLPSGTWRKTVDITAPADIDANTHFVNVTKDYTLVAADPSIILVAGAGVAGAADQGDHWHPGEPLLVGAALFHSQTRLLLPPDSIPVPTVMIGRFNVSLGRAEYLAADLTWQQLTGSAAAHAWDLSPSPGDPSIWIRTFSDTSAFGLHDLHLVAVAYYNGNPYRFGTQAEAVALTANAHDGFSLDPVGLALNGVLGQR